MKKNYILPLGLHYFFFTAVFALLSPQMQILLSKKGFNIEQIGWLLGVQQVVGILGPLLLAAPVDRHAKYKRALLVLLVLIIPTFIALIQFSTFWTVLIIMAISGILLRSIVPFSDAYASHLLEKPDKQYGPIRTMGSIGFLSLSFFIDFSGILESNYQARFLIIMIAVLIPVFLIILFLLPSKVKHLQSDNKGSLKPDKPLDIRFWFILGILFLGWLGKSSYFSFYSLYLNESGIFKVNLQWALGALCEIPLLFFSGWILKKFSLKNLMIIALFTVAFRLGLFALTPGKVILTASQLLHAITFGLLHICSISFINRNTGPSQRALGMVLYMSVARGGAGFIGSAVGGMIAINTGLASLYGIYAIPPLIGLILLLFYKPKEQKEVNSAN